MQPELKKKIKMDKIVHSLNLQQILSVSQLELDLSKVDVMCNLIFHELPDYVVYQYVKKEYPQSTLKPTRN